MTDNRESPWQRTVVTGLAALGIAAVVIGVVAGLMAFGLTRASGVGAGSGSSAPESLYMPPYTQTPIEQVTPKALGSGNADDEGDEEEKSKQGDESSTMPEDTPTSTAPASPSQTAGEIVVAASPTQIAPGGRVTLSGTVTDGTGDLQVQRLEGGAWVDFPVTAGVKSDGTFSTTVSSSRPGQHSFRIFDPATGRSSNAVIVMIG